VHPHPVFLPYLRMTLVAVGTLVWGPYLVARYLLDEPFPAWWVLVVHIPCMLGALGLRIWQAFR
jgi:uncharacterized membrane protein YhaH (DUF805 family)